MSKFKDWVLEAYEEFDAYPVAKTKKAKTKTKTAQNNFNDLFTTADEIYEQQQRDIEEAERKFNRTPKYPGQKI